ncbi:hypothetical protein L208DRAFT_1290017 [Tricholoma matsutake]|nr:hypothetical protein L208DRAFT_1290017 [Tricholoma matsutake 945]
MSHSFPSEHHYIRLAISPPNNDTLVLRKTLQDSLTQTFGITSSSTYIDILWVADGGDQFVIRVGNGDAAKILAAIVVWSNSPRITILKESPFLPSLLSTDIF